MITRWTLRLSLFAYLLIGISAVLSGCRETSLVEAHQAIIKKAPTGSLQVSEVRAHAAAYRQLVETWRARNELVGRVAANATTFPQAYRDVVSSPAGTKHPDYAHLEQILGTGVFFPYPSYAEFVRGNPLGLAILALLSMAVCLFLVSGRTLFRSLMGCAVLGAFLSVGVSWGVFKGHAWLWGVQSRSLADLTVVVQGSVAVEGGAPALPPSTTTSSTKTATDASKPEATATGGTSTFTKVLTGVVAVFCALMVIGGLGAVGARLGGGPGPSRGFPFTMGGGGSRCEVCGRVCQVNRPPEWVSGMGAMMSMDEVNLGMAGLGDECKTCGRLYCTRCAVEGGTCRCGSQEFRTVALRYGMGTQQPGRW